jgi:hypothetical protein
VSRKTATKHYVVIWKAEEEDQTWSTYQDRPGSVKTFTYDQLDLDADIDRVIDMADVDLLKPENSDRVTGMRLAVTSDVATRWLGWPLDD